MASNYPSQPPAAGPPPVVQQPQPQPQHNQQQQQQQQQMQQQQQQMSGAGVPQQHQQHQPPQGGVGGAPAPPTPQGMVAAARAPEPPQFVKPRTFQSKKTFVNELMNMMYGFGDDENPLPETVDVMDDIVVDFVTNLAKSAVNLSQIKGKGGKLVQEDILFLVRKHPKMYFRAKELIKKDKEISSARNTRKDTDLGAL